MIKPYQWKLVTYQNEENTLHWLLSPILVYLFMMMRYSSNVDAMSNQLRDFIYLNFVRINLLTVIEN